MAHKQNSKPGKAPSGKTSAAAAVSPGAAMAVAAFYTALVQAQLPFNSLIMRPAGNFYLLLPGTIQLANLNQFFFVLLRREHICFSKGLPATYWNQHKYMLCCGAK